jgi:hypothetical protein
LIRAAGRLPRLLAHRVAPRLQLLGRERVGVACDAETRAHAGEVERLAARVETDVAQDAGAVLLGEVAVDLRQLAEQVHFGRVAADRAVDE